MSLASARRYLSRAMLVPVAVVVVGAAVVWGPWSPLALDRANELYVAGQTVAARDAYADIAGGWHTPGTRAAAAWRAGLLSSELQDSQAAAEWLRKAADLAPERQDRARAQLELARLYASVFRQPERAAEAYERAARENGDPRSLALAARQWEAAGATARALTTWRAAEPGLGALSRAEVDEARAAVARLAGELDGAAMDDSTAEERHLAEDIEGEVQ